MNTHLPAKERIRISALLVSSKLDKYIELHDLILKRGGSLRSFVKNLLGIPVPFDQFVQRAKELEKELSSVISGIVSMKGNIKETMTLDEAEYLDCLLSYASSLHETIVALCQRQQAYLQKSRGSKLDWSTAKALDESYKKAIQRYQEVGGKLNQLSHVVF